MTSEYDIQLRHPAPYDIIGTQVTLAGIGTAFEATYVWRLQADGRTIAEGHFQAGYMATMAGFAYTEDIDISYSGPATLQFASDSGADEGPLFNIEVPVIVVEGALGYVPHQVQKGETLTSIAKSYSSTVETIAMASRLANPDEIEEGQILRVPS